MTTKIYAVFIVSLLLHIYNVETITEIPTFFVNTTEVFHLRFKEHIFNKYGDIRNNTNVKYRASIESMPDLPDWIQYVHSHDGDGYLYGVPSQPGEIKIEIIATNKYNYDTYRKVIALVQQEREIKAINEVEMRFSNLNIEDMFHDHRLERVKKIFVDWLWKKDVYLTLVESAIKMGGRLPANPDDKEGVIIRVGSEANFSITLGNLLQEVIPLRQRVPCPKDYKKTLAERYFRDDDFIPDWCGFRLHSTSPKIKKDSRPMHSPVHLTSDDFRPPSLAEPSRDLTSDFIFSIVIPITVALALLIILSFFMCCYHEGIENRNKDNPSIQMVQYASIQRASNNLRSMASKRDMPMTANHAPGSTIPRSYGNSPNNTLGSTTSAKRRESQGTLSGSHNLPPLYIPQNPRYN